MKLNKSIHHYDRIPRYQIEGKGGYFLNKFSAYRYALTAYCWKSRYLYWLAIYTNQGITKAKLSNKIIGRIESYLDKRAIKKYAK